MARTPFPTLSIPLSGVAVNYAGINMAQRGYIADRVAPRRRITSQQFHWFSSKIDEAFTVEDTQIDRLGQVNEILQGWTRQDDSTRDFALSQPVPRTDEMEASVQGIPFNLRASAARNVTNRVQLGREIRVATLVNSAGSYLTGYTADKTAARWSDFANSDPVADVRDAQSKMLVRPNVGVTSRRVADILERHPKVAAALGGSLQSGQYNDLARVARLFNLREIIVGDTLYQTSKPGQSLTTGNIWADNFAMHYQDGVAADGTTSLSSADDQSPAFLATFQLGDWIANEELVEPGQMGILGGVRVMVGERLRERQIAPYAGFLFQNVVTAAA
jgi:hypothetical protein